MSNQFFTLPYQPSIGDGFGIDISGLEVDVFVDGINGDDRRGGRSADDALQTIEMARQKFALLAMDGTVININLAGVGGFGANATEKLTYKTRTVMVGGSEVSRNTYHYTGPEMVRVIPATGPSTATLSAIDQVDQAGVVTFDGQRTRFTFAGAPGWTADDFQGKFLRITRDGTLAVFEQIISKNTADEIFVDTADLSFGAVLLTDFVEIVEPGVKIEGPDADFNQFVCLGWSSGNKDSFASGEVPNTFARIEFGADFSTWSGIAGLSFDRCLMTGTNPIIRNCDVSFASLSVLSGSQGLKLVNCFSSDSPAASFNPPDNVPLDNFAGVGFQVAGASIQGWQQIGGNIFAQRSYSFWDCSTGMQVEGGRFQNTAPMQGINTATGIRCLDNGVVIVSDDPNFILVTGTGLGALRVGFGASIGYGTGVGEFQEAAGYNGNFTRKNDGSAAAPEGDASVIRVVLF